MLQAPMFDGDTFDAGALGEDCFVPAEVGVRWRHVARPIQGWPVIVQAGASEAGKLLAAESAELVFAGPSELGPAQRLYADIKGRAEKAGRRREHIKILPGVFVVIGETIKEAQEKKRRLDGLVHPDSCISTLSVLLGCDASGFELDGPLSEIPESNVSQSGRQKLVDMAARESMTVRELAQHVGGSFGMLEMAGTPASIVDQMQEWFLGEACDGFNLMFPYLPGGLDEFVDLIVPELQRRGLFRREYEGVSLRENMGLPRPANRFFPAADESGLRSG